MNRQDKGSVRTAQDLERKYNLAGMTKAIRLQEEGLHKTNNTLEAYINNVLKSADNIKSQTDGEITSWFYTGEPTLGNEPASYWTTDEQKEAHVGDLYYDRGTGYAYLFEIVDGKYKWSIVTDSSTIESLAIANSEYDATDNKRRIFVETPYPPYENGDLWFKDKEIYICQISRAAVNSETGEAEVYMDGDFIIATKYTDDTVAIGVGEDLKVLQGQVLTIQDDANQFRIDLDDLDQNTKASIDLINESLSTIITGVNGESLMTQTENGWVFSIESLLNTVSQAVDDVGKLEKASDKTINDLNGVKDALEGVAKITSYMRVYEVDGEPYLELGTSGNGFKSVHTNKGIQFMTGDTVQAYIDYEALNIEKAVIHEELKVGGFLLKERANGNVGFVWRGDDE